MSLVSSLACISLCKDQTLFFLPTWITTLEGIWLLTLPLLALLALEEYLSIQISPNKMKIADYFELSEKIKESIRGDKLDCLT